MSDFFDDLETKMDSKADEDSQALSGEQWDPAEGEMLKGVLTRAEVVKASGRRSIVLNVINRGDDSGGIAPGGTATIWGSRTVLKSALLREQPAIGKALAIRFDGSQESQTGGNAFFMYTVLCEEADPVLWGKLEAELEKRGFDDDNVSDNRSKTTDNIF